MDPFNLSRYANLTVQRVQPPEEKPLPKGAENDEEEDDDCSDEEDDFSGSDEETNKTLEIPKTNDNPEVESADTVVPSLTDDEVQVKLEPQNVENELENEIPTNEQNDEEIEAKSKRKSGEEEDDQTPKKAKMNEDKTSDEDTDNQTASEKRATNMRRNIREVMDETKLDESTLAAQRQEMERLRRVQEQQRIIREVQKQIAINRQNSKAQDRVMSLLQGGTTSLIKKNSVPTEPQVQPKPNTIVISTDSGSPQIFNKKMLEILKSQPDSLKNCNEVDKLSSIASKLGDVNEPHMVTSSVSIAPIKPAKVAEVVTISSGSDEEEEVERKPQSSDDDCILISGDEEEEEIADDDTHNSGMHTNDAYNLPDESGRVLINVGHPENEPDVFLAPQIARIIKPHQVGGVRFLYDNVVESLERFKSSKGFGCILAHSMGLGKTLQVVSFCDVFLRHTPAKHVLCIMPINTLQNWMAEFNMWLPLPDDMKIKSEDATENAKIIHRQFPLFVLNDFHKTITARGKVIQNWRIDGGVLLMGYELYRQLTSRKPRKKRNKKQMDEDFYDEKNKPLLDEMREALVKPGPDLVICDEGHRIKNSHASTSQSLKEIESRRRVVLTGYPLQNNLLEYWCMVDFVRPNYLGTKTEFSNMFERPIQNGQCIDSTPQDIRLMRHRAHVLHSLLEGFVQRRSHSVLEKTLPQKEEFVLLVRMTPLQRLLYDRFMNEVVRKKAVPNPLKAFAVCCKIWNHPDILYYFLKKRSLDEAEIDLDLEEASTPLGTPLGPTPATSPSAASKRSRNRWPKGGGMNPNSKELKSNQNRKNVKKDQMKTPAIATVMPNTSNNQLISPTHNHSTTVAAQSTQSNQFDDFPSQSQQYGNQSNFANQQFNNYNQNYNSPYWKESGNNFYRGNSEYYQSNRSSDTKEQYPYPQDPRLEVGEIRMVKSEPSYQNYEETSYSGSNDQNIYPNRGFNQDTTQGTELPEQPMHSQGFSPDVPKVNQGHFSSQGTNQESLSCQNILNIPGLQTENISDRIPMTKPKPKNVRNRKSTINIKQIQKSQLMNMTSSRVHVDNSCNDNDSNLTNKQGVSNTKEISFSQAFNQGNSREVHSNNQGLFTNNQDILKSKDMFGSSSRNNEDMQFNNSHTSLSESNKGIYGGNLIKPETENRTTGMAVSFEGIFDNNGLMTNHQKSNLNHQHVQQNVLQTTISPVLDINNSLSNNQGTLGNRNNQNQGTNHQIIDNPRIMNNNQTNQGMLLCDTNNQGQITNSQVAVQHPMPISHDNNMLTGHQEIEQKFVNQQQQQQLQHQQQQQQQHQQQQHQQQQHQQQQHQQQQQQQHHQQQQQHHQANQEQQLQQQQQHHQISQEQQQQYQSSDSILSSQGQIPLREPFMNLNNPNNSYGNYMLESNQHMTNQNHSYGNLLPVSPFQNQNILNDQMLHDQELLLANDQAMLSVLNSTTDANEQALLYNAMVGQPDGQSLLGLLEPPSMLNNPINEYQPVYGPLPPNVKPGLPGGAKTNPESNQYPRTPNIQQMTGRGGVNLMSGAHNQQNEVKMYPESNRYNVSNSNESYSRYSNYPPMYPPYTPSSSTPLGSISDILDNIPGPERTYQPPERKNPAPCTMTSQDVNPLPPFRSLDNKTKYEYGGTGSNSEIDQSLDEKITSFSADKESRSLEDIVDPKMSTLEEGEIKNPSLFLKSGKEEPGIPYDWALELFNDYVPGMIEASAKMSLLFAIVEESVRIGDRVLLFSQSLFTLDLIEEFLQRNKIPGKDENWCRNCDYYRLDGSTSASEREKLINDFNICNTVHLFLVSTRAGSLGINLVGANRVIVFDASWNPCHDTQAVCRVYRYGQQKPCYVYRLVTDNCLEKKIYDRQINKQVMADRVVDECNPDAHLSIKEVTNLCWDDGESKPTEDFSSLKDNYDDVVIKHIVENFSSVLTKEPFQHESLFVDRKDKKLSQAEKRLAKRSYEMEKKANSRPMYSYYGQNNTSTLYRNQMGKPMASVRPMQSMSNTSSVMASRNALNRRWIPAEVWQKQGMSAQEMTLPLDVVIPTNAGDRGSIVLKAGQKVMVLKSPKGIYMQLESGKIIAIRTSANNKPINNASLPNSPVNLQPQPTQHSSMAYNRALPVESNYNNSGPKNDVAMQQLRNRSNLLRNNPSISITPKHVPSASPSRSVQPPSYMAPSHSSAIGLPQSSSPAISSSTYPHKLPSSITLTKFDRSPIATHHKSSEIGIQANSTHNSYGPRYPPEYPRSPFERYPVRNEYNTQRMSQPYANNNYPPQYHRPSSSQ